MKSKRVLVAAIAAAAILAAVLGGLSVSARGQLAGDTRGQAVSNAAIDWNAIASSAIIAPAPAGAGQPPQRGRAQPGHGAGGGLRRGQRDRRRLRALHRRTAGRPGGLEGGGRGSRGIPRSRRPIPRSQQATLQPVYDAFLASVPDGPGKAGGIAVGEAAAAAMLAARANDGRGDPFTFVFGTDPGEWRPTPPNFGLDPTPWVANVRPFLVPDVEMLRTDGPNALTSSAYAKDFNEVKRLGSLTSTKRTADQTAASIFWQDSGLAIWNRVFRALATSEELDIVDSARMLAMTNLAAADGSIGCWNDKYYWNFWRPITAIHEAANDGNPATEPDPAWLPLFNPTVPVSGPPLVTPGFPDHPSGHTCISGAIAYTLKAFFGTDKVEFTVVSNRCSPAPCPDRTFRGFSAALKEIIDARVWSGIHFRTADEQGAELGKEVARWLQKHYFKHT